LSILRKWEYGERWKETPIDSELRLVLSMNESKDIELLKNLTPFALPPLDCIIIYCLTKAERNVRHFLAYSLGQQKELTLNYDGKLLDGSKWVETIIIAIPKLKEKVSLERFRFSKEQVEAIIDN
jgi:hypothetical protein